ncbi:MAG: BrnA antitoxin family protein [Pseudomonadota bacterium]
MANRTRTERRHATRMIDDLESLDADVALASKNLKLLPGGWFMAESSAPCTPQKDRLTLRVDRDVLGWYRKLGRGYQARMNLVLRAYMDSIISRSVKDSSAFDWQGREI